MNPNPPVDPEAAKQLSGFPGWIWGVAGLLLGAALVGLFLAYGQPQLLLEQMNLRYCG